MVAKKAEDAAKDQGRLAKDGLYFQATASKCTAERGFDLPKTIGSFSMLIQA
jgi:hypothetical protein